MAKVKASPQVVRIAKSLGERIERARVAKGYTQSKLARRCGVNSTTALRWETGEIEPRLAQLYQIADALEIERARLIVGNERVRIGAEDAA